MARLEGSLGGSTNLRAGALGVNYSVSGTTLYWNLCGYWGLVDNHVPLTSQDAYNDTGYVKIYLNGVEIYSLVGYQYQYSSRCAYLDNPRNDWMNFTGGSSWMTHPQHVVSGSYGLSYGNNTLRLTYSGMRFSTSGGWYNNLATTDVSTTIKVARPTSTISYNANGGTSTPSSQVVTTGSTIQLPSAISHSNTTDTGYTITFNPNGGVTSKTSETATRIYGWNFNKWAAGSTSGTQYSAGASYTVSADITMWATWTTSITSQGTVTLPTATQCTRSGYTLLGFSLSSSATTASWAPGASYSPDADKTLYAIWSQSVFTIVYNANGGTSTPAPTIKNAGVNVNITNEKPLYPNYIFKGWGTNPILPTVLYHSGDTYTLDLDIILYAIWEKPDFNYIKIWDTNLLSWENYEPYIWQNNQWVKYDAFVYNTDVNAWEMCGDDPWAYLVTSDDKKFKTSDGEYLKLWEPDLII